VFIDKSSMGLFSGENCQNEILSALPDSSNKNRCQVVDN
jgi:hypothetical protein